MCRSQYLEVPVDLRELLRISSLWMQKHEEAWELGMSIRSVFAVCQEPTAALHVTLSMETPDGAGGRCFYHPQLADKEPDDFIAHTQPVG